MIECNILGFGTHPSSKAYFSGIKGSLFLLAHCMTIAKRRMRMMSPPAPAAMIIQALYDRSPFSHLPAVDTVYLYMSSPWQLKSRHNECFVRSCILRWFSSHARSNTGFTFLLIDFFYTENNYLSWLTLPFLRHYKILRAPLNYQWEIWSKAKLVRFYLLSRYILIRLATPFKPWYNNAISIVGNITPYAFLSSIRSNHYKKHNHTTHLHKCT